MITAWMVYALVVGGLVAGAGLALERLLRTHNLPTRWVWVAAVLLSVGWPLGHWGWENRPTAPLPLPQAEAPPASPATRSAPDFLPTPVTVEVGPESVLRRLDGPLLVGWALTTGLSALFLLALAWRTQRLRNSWQSARVGGEEILLSEDWGPAVVGLRRPRVVLPRWCQEVDEGTLRFVLDHELEHVRAGDLRLLLLVGIVPVLFPWHLPTWWQLARLRAAVEGDCDLRVLRRHPGQTRRYIDLLLQIGRRPALPRPLAAMLSEPYATLKRRIRIMTMPIPKRPWLTGSALAALTVVLGALACGAPAPTDASVDDPAATAGADQTVEGRDARPTFTPYSVLPALDNRSEIAAALSGSAAELNVSGTPTGEVWFFIGTDGRVQDTRISHSTGEPALDRAILMVAERMRFLPALNRDQEQAVWVALPVAFGADPAGPAGSTVERVVTEAVAASWPSTGETGIVEGVVLDRTSGRPLATAQVFVRGTGRGTLADAEGRFRIEGVPVGAREVVAHLVGYQDVTTPVSITTDGAARVEAGLQATAIQLAALIVPVGGG